MLLTYKNSKKQGDAGLGLAIGYFCSYGHPVAIPLTDSQDYDLIVEVNGLKKIQVKTTKHKTASGLYEVGLRVLGGNSRTNYIHKHAHELDYDSLFVVTGDGAFYLIPKTAISHLRSSLVLGAKYRSYRVSWCPR